MGFPDGVELESATGESDRARALSRVRQLVRIWDEAFALPGGRWRVGLDAVVGLIPGVGDLIGVVVSCYPILVALQYGAGAAMVARMVLNVAIDGVVGLPPLLGDLLDIGWKANRRNQVLLERWLAAPTATRRSSRWLLATVTVTLVGLLGALTWAVSWVVRTIF